MYSLGMTYSAQKISTNRWEGSAQHTRVDTGLADITDSRALNHVPHSETLDGLVLADASRAVGAADEVDVATALLVASVISSLLGLHNEFSKRVHQTECRSHGSASAESSRHPA